MMTPDIAEQFDFHNANHWCLRWNCTRILDYRLGVSLMVRFAQTPYSNLGILD